MKRIFVWALALLFLAASFSACAEDSIKEAYDAVFSYAIGDNLQEWLDKTATEAAGSTMDNYVIVLNRFGADADFSNYVQAALGRLEPGEMSNPVSRQRCALSVISCGGVDLLPEGLADETIGKLGVMSYVYGLHLLNNGAESESWTAASLLDSIFALQKQDGGWAVMGQFGDVDVTAMVLQVLACNKGNNIRASESIERALDFLSGKQLASGGFSANGRENSESCAQVILALSSLGIDAETDARFIKDGIGILDALLAYQMVDGGFAHLPDEGKSNETASVQAAQALAAYMHIGERYFDFSDIELRSFEPQQARSWKFWALIAVAIFASAGIVFSLTRRHGRLKQLLFVLLVSAIAAGAICAINIESASSYYTVDLPTGKDIAGQVAVSIRCDAVAGSADDESTPLDGIILKETVIPFREGDSVFDVLTYAVRMNKIQMEHEGGSEGMAYVSGINYLYEYVYGDLSGWMYFVNGESPSVGCGSYTVSDGDELLWQYTTMLGEDLK